MFLFLKNIRKAMQNEKLVLDGTGRFTVGGEIFILTEGETLIMPKDVPHAVYGQEKFKMELVVSF